MNRHEVKHALDSTLVSVLATTPQSETREERPLPGVCWSLTRESLDPRLPGTLTITQIGVHVAKARLPTGRCRL